jgi:hypothetical protein
MIHGNDDTIICTGTLSNFNHKHFLDTTTQPPPKHTKVDIYVCACVCGGGGIAASERVVTFGGDVSWDHHH